MSDKIRGIHSEHTAEVSPEAVLAAAEARRDHKKRPNTDEVASAWYQEEPSMQSTPRVEKSGKGFRIFEQMVLVLVILGVVIAGFWAFTDLHNIVDAVDSRVTVVEGRAVETDKDQKATASKLSSLIGGPTWIPGQEDGTFIEGSVAPADATFGKFQTEQATKFANLGIKYDAEILSLKNEQTRLDEALKAANTAQEEMKKTLRGDAGVLTRLSDTEDQAAKLNRKFRYEHDSVYQQNQLAWVEGRLEHLNKRTNPSKKTLARIERFEKMQDDLRAKLHLEPIVREQFTPTEETSTEDAPATDDNEQEVPTTSTDEPAQTAPTPDGPPARPPVEKLATPALTPPAPTVVRDPNATPDPNY